jgi:hypothetical protein
MKKVFVIIITAYSFYSCETGTKITLVQSKKDSLLEIVFTLFAKTFIFGMTVYLIQLNLDFTPKKMQKAFWNISALKVLFIMESTLTNGVLP